ncbi:MAG: phosphorylated adapter RNA export RNA-binding domain-containing protein [Chloroflexota bacterium]|nr:phosphorylated adapter RNA export RNA-binding domain-containing protein [Chloroflexota bacterium]
MSTDTSTPSKHQLKELAARICNQIGESEAGPRHQVYRTLQTLGTERTLALVEQTLQIERSGGMMLPDHSRRRTPGGIFFLLVRQQTTSRQEYYQIFHPGWLKKHKRQPEGEQTQQQSQPDQPQFNWDEYGELARHLQTQPGEAKSVKITVIGKPGKVIEREQLVMVGLKSEKSPAFPKGVPSPAGPTSYVVLIARKHWQNIAQALTDPEDALIVEGHPSYDSRFAGITVHATQVTTRKLQAAKRQAS